MVNRIDVKRIIARKLVMILGDGSLAEARIDTLMSNSFGFGGTNATLVFQRV